MTFILLFISNVLLAKEVKISVSSVVNNNAPAFVKHLKELYSKVGLIADIDVYPAKRAYVAGVSGDYDAIGLRIKEFQDYSTKFIRIDIPIIKDLNFSLFYSEDLKESDIESNSFDNYELCYLNGAVYMKVLQKKFSFKNLRPIGSAKTGFQMLAANRVHGCFMADVIVKLQPNLLKSNVRKYSKPFHTSHMYHYINIKLSGLREQMQSEMKKMQLDGKFYYELVK